MKPQSRPTKLLSAMIDFTPNVLKTEGGKKQIEASLRASFEQSLPGALTRWGELPVMMTPAAPFAELLMDARQHFIWGRFYSCVVMCGVAAERILKDLFVHALRVRVGGEWLQLTPEVARQIERLDVEGIREALLKSGNLDRGLRKSVQRLMELRNSYVHSRYAQPEEDARAAVRCLHEMVEGTVSVFKDHEFVDGILMPRQPSVTTPASGPDNANSGGKSP